MIFKYTIIFIFFVCSLRAQEGDQFKHSKISDHKIIGYIDIKNKALYFQSISHGSALMLLPSSIINLDKHISANNGYLKFDQHVNQSTWIKSIPADAPHVHRDKIDIINYSEVGKIIEKNGFINAWANIILMDVDTRVVSGPYIMKNPIIIKHISNENLDKSKLLIIPLK